ncbi:MAG: sugar ABC transporter permease [Clostridia bacterium]|nr:sugar ABC transporter permease [Clostridia bacterium]
MFKKAETNSIAKKRTIADDIRKDYKRNKYVIQMAIPVFLYYLIFRYIPMCGISIAFFDYNIAGGFFESSFVGLKHFKDFLTGFYAARTIRNTLLISLMQLAIGFPIPIIFALLLNEVRSKKFKSTVQTLSYLPHFISLVVVCGLIINFTGEKGIINDIVELFGGERKNLLMEPQYFRWIYVISGVWQEMGWGAIIYLAALAGIDPFLYEAATMDGAGRFKQTLYVTLPGIAPTIIVMLILNVGKMMTVGSDKIILLYNANTYETADVISSFVYRRGIVESNYSYSTAVNLFNSVINIILITLTNYISRTVSENSLW